jgi:hypothetical protein
LGPLGIYAQLALENTIGNLGREVHQHSNPFMNLSERGLLRARINAAKALVHDFDQMTNALPRVACNLGEGYAFLPEKEAHQHVLLEGLIEDLAIQAYLEEIYPEQPASFSVQRWARLQLPNGQHVWSAFKEKLLIQPCVSCNVKVSKSLVLSIPHA